MQVKQQHGLQVSLKKDERGKKSSKENTYTSKSQLVSTS